MNRLRVRIISGLSLILFSQLSLADDFHQAMGAMFDGPPRLATTMLDLAAYVPEQVQRLAHGKVAYVNWDALEDIMRGLGLKSAPRQLTPELAAAILEKAGFAKRVPGESADFYLDEFRSLYSIRYGGDWINYNFGSGRNGAAGMVDIKGIGPTSLVRPWADGGHSNGTMSLADAVKEAHWSNTLYQELPKLANRVLFIFTTGTRVDPNDPHSEPRAILVREDPLRPAYFQPNSGVTSELMEASLRASHISADRLRMQKVLPRLIEALPMPPGLPADASAAQKIHAGLLELIDRAAWQYGTAYTRQILLAGVSTSNIEIDGRAMDYGSTSAVIGFPKAKIIPGESPHGTTDTLKSDLIFELARDLRRELPLSLRSAIPSDQELSQRTDQEFHRRVRQGFLELAGAPKEFSEQLEKTAEGRALSETLLKITQAGNQKVHPWSNGSLVGRTGTYNLERVLNVASRLLFTDAPDVQQELARALPNQKLRQELSENYVRSYQTLASLTEVQGIRAPALQRFTELAVPARNHSMYSVRDRWSMWERYFEISRRYFTGADDNAVQKLIDGLTERNVHDFKTAPYQLEVTDRTAKKRGKATHLVFNLITGETRVVVKQLAGYHLQLEHDDAPADPRGSAGRSCSAIFGW